MLSWGFKFYRIVFLILTVLLLALHFYTGISWLWAVLPLFLFGGMVGYGSANIDSQFFMKTLCNGDKSKKQIALTFDDGPHPEFTPMILETLKKHGVKATFFLIGKNIPENPRVVKNIESDGHLIGNHSFSHVNSFAFKSVKIVKDELKHTNLLVSGITGKAPAFFRPPFGVTSPRIAQAVDMLGFKTIGWSLRSLDTTGDSADKITERVTSQIKGGEIILLHDTFLKTTTVLENILIYCKNQNVEIVPLDKMLAEKAYV